MKNKFTSNEKGQSLVEIALSSTLILFILLASIDFGFAFLYWITIRDAAEEGAVYGSLHPGLACNAELENWVTGAASAPFISLDSAVINVDRSGGSNPGDPITVNVTHDYHILTPMVSVFIGSPNISIQTSVTNTILQVDPACP